MLKKVLGTYDRPVFFTALLICLLLTVLGTINPRQVALIVNMINNFIVSNFGWWYLLVVAAFIVFIIWCAFGPYGKIVLGKDGEKPEFSFFEWFAMLFSAGVGVGLFFWGVAEPLFHYYQPPYGASATPEAAIQALRITVLHWGVHGWVTYAVIGLPIAYYTFRYNRPMTVATGLIGAIGNQPECTFLGRVINFFTVVATVFGVATALGVGVISVRYGISKLFGTPLTSEMAVFVIIVITVLYIVSAVLGVKKGIRFFSLFNIIIVFCLLPFFYLFGPARFMLDMVVNTIGDYLNHFIFMTFWTDPIEKSGWLGSWTVFYWAWWITWAPFMGCFLARISRGRTVREFVMGSIIIPTVFCLIWFTSIGSATLYFEIFQKIPIFSKVQKDIGAGIFVLLDNYPFPWLIGLIVLISLVLLFVTSADSASFIIAKIVSHENQEPRNCMKVIWGGLIGVIAAVLLIAGGLNALQSATIIAGLPFSIAMLVFMYSTVKGFRNDRASLHG
jgi:glycine betaine transporter